MRVEGILSHWALAMFLVFMGMSYDPAGEGSVLRCAVNGAGMNQTLSICDASYITQHKTQAAENPTKTRRKGAVDIAGA